ncbi:MAG: peptidylprolyl isomerase [Acidobacteriota bacterium]
MTGFRNMTFKRFILLLALVLVGGCAAPEKEEIQPTQAEPPIIASINGRPVYQDQFEGFLSLTPNEPGEEPVQSQRSTRFREFVMEQLLLQEAEKKEVTVDEALVREQLASWLSEGQEVTPDLGERVRTFLRIQKFIKQEIRGQIEIGNQEMQRYYRRHSDEYKVDDEYHVLEILLEDRERAEEIRAQLNFGDVRTFKSMARSYSQGLTAQAGGDLGTFRSGQLPENFEKVIFQLKAGEFSAVFRSPEGYHIFMMEEWVPRHAQKFHEVQEAIFEKLVGEKESVALEEYVDQLFQSASIEVHDRTLSLE